MGSAVSAPASIPQSSAIHAYQNPTLETLPDMAIDDEFIAAFDAAISSLIEDPSNEADETLRRSSSNVREPSPDDRHWLRLEHMFSYPADGGNTNSMGLYWPGGTRDLEAEIRFYDLATDDSLHSYTFKDNNNI